MALIEEQERVQRWPAGRLAVIGAAGSGKTTALVERFLHLVSGGAAPSRVLVVSRDRRAAGWFLETCLPRLSGGFDALPVTTFAGVAFDILSRAGVERRLISGAERWAFLRDLLEDEARAPDAAARWPALHPYLGRTALVDEVATGLARGPGADGEVSRFAARYADALDRRGLVDFPRLLDLAVRHAGEQSPRFDHLLVDDFESATRGAAALLDVVAGWAGSIVVAGNPDAAIGSLQGSSPSHLAAFAGGAAETLSLPRRLRPEATRELVRCHHPALEPEAVAAAVLAAAAEGVPWSRIAVLVRRPAVRARAISRALARHGVPVSAVPAGLSEEPVVAALLDLLRWAGGDEGAPSRLLASALSGLAPADVERVRRDARDEGRSLAEDPTLDRLRAVRDELAAHAGADDVASLAHRAFRRTLAGLVAEAGDPAGAPDRESGRALDAAVAFLGELDGFVEQHPAASLRDYLRTLDAPTADPDAWQAPAVLPGPAGAVTVTSLAAAAGREWDLVVVAGCVEGELPQWPRTRGPLGPSSCPETTDRLAEERRLFGLAAGAATTRLVATAGPEPGQLLSRFVDGWPEAELGAVAGFAAGLTPGAPRAASPRRLAETSGMVPVWPAGELVLSASKLTTYADCPLKFAFSYGLRVRDAGSVWASLGSLFHEVAAEFLEPGSGDPDRSRERLLRIAEAHWSDDIAPYRPQREEIRRDLYDMLDTWYALEFGGHGAPDVVAVERRFTIDVGEHKVTGFIDRVDRIGGGLAVIDYKTGKHPLPEAEVAEDLQLAVYHLAASRDPDLVAEGPPLQLILRYVRAGMDRNQPIAPDHAAQTEARITDAAREIVAESFDPALDADCDHCDFHRLCPLQREGREVGAA